MKKVMHKWVRSLGHHLVPNVGTVLAVALLLFVYNAWAAPQAAPLTQSAGTDELSYQGQLLGSGGSPVNGQVEMTFRIYNVPTGGTALWTEAHTGGNSVPVDNGRFHVLLGSLTPIPSSVWENDDLYLEVQVGSEVLSPRELLGGVPVAGLASAGKSGFTVSGYLRIKDGTDQARLQVSESGHYSRIVWGDDTDDKFVIFFDNCCGTDREVLTLYANGNGRLDGYLSQEAQAKEQLDTTKRSTTLSSFGYFGSSSLSLNLSDTSLVYVYIRAAMTTNSDQRTGQVALNIDGENHGHESDQPIYVENIGTWRTMGAGAIVELGAGQHTIRPVFRVVNGGATLEAGEVGYGYFILGRKP